MNSCLFTRHPSGNDQELNCRASLNKSWGERSKKKKKKKQQYLLFFILSCVNNKTLAPAGIMHLAARAVSSPPTEGKKKKKAHTRQVSVTRSWHFHLLCDMRLCGCDTSLMYRE